MALKIQNPTAENLIAKLAELTGETETEAVTRALEDRLARLQREKSGLDLVDELEAAADRLSRLPVLDDRTADEILGYDENGLPR